MKTKNKKCLDLHTQGNGQGSKEKSQNKNRKKNEKMTIWKFENSYVTLWMFNICSIEGKVELDMCPVKIREFKNNFVCSSFCKS